MVSLGLDPEEDLEALLLLGHRQHRELSIVDVRQNVTPGKNQQENEGSGVVECLQVRILAQPAPWTSIGTHTGAVT